MEASSAPDWNKVDTFFHLFMTFRAEKSGDHNTFNTLYYFQSIRDDQEFVALSSNQKNRARVGRRKSLASQRRLSKSKLSTGKLDAVEVKKISEQEKDRMVNILMVKTGFYLLVISYHLMRLIGLLSEPKTT